MGFDPGSFRDPAARVVRHQGSVYRLLTQVALDDWLLLSAKDFFRVRTQDGSIVGTRRVELHEAQAQPGDDRWAAALRHDTIPFVSYPYEWAYSMLRDGAALQLELLLDALAEGMTLKDGTAYNIQWQGCDPVFIDTPSFEKFEAGSAWAGYRQFCETFLYPLMLSAYRQLPFQLLLRGRLDGIEPEVCRAALSLRDYLRPGVLKHVLLHANLDRRHRNDSQNVRTDMRRMEFNSEVVATNARSMLRLVRGLPVPAVSSEWSEYVKLTHYDEEARVQKDRFVSAVTEARPRAMVWDLGSNTGKYSRMAARNAESVVAFDSDSASIELLYRQLKADGTSNILPLQLNLVDPSPGLGWRGRERLPIEKRATPDLVLCLALVHHVALGSNIPLAEFIDWLASLGAELVIEFVDKEDPMAQRLLRNKGDIFPGYDRAQFEQCLGACFDDVHSQVIQGGLRVLYHAQPRKP